MNIEFFNSKEISNLIDSPNRSKIELINEKINLQIKYLGDLLTQKIETLVSMDPEIIDDKLQLDLKQIDYLKSPLCFTIGICNYKFLFITLNFKWNELDEEIDPKLISKFEELIPHSAKSKLISISDHDWISLAEESAKFIKYFYIEFHSILRKTNQLMN